MNVQVSDTTDDDSSTKSWFHNVVLISTFATLANQHIISPSILHQQSVLFHAHNSQLQKPGTQQDL